MGREPNRCPAPPGARPCGAAAGAAACPPRGIGN